MKNQAAAQKVQEVIPTMTIVEKTATEKPAKVINFKASAEDVKSEAITDEVITPEVITQNTTSEVITQEVKPEVLLTPIIEAKLVQSIEDIKRKSEVLSRLTVKWDALNEKRKRVENFAISHDGDTAAVRVFDASGEVFESNSPKTIGKLIEFWKEEFSDTLEKVEKEMREIA